MNTKRFYPVASRALKMYRPLMILIVLSLSFWLLPSKALAQSQYVTLPAQTVTVKQMFDAIERQTNFKLVYSTDIISVSDLVKLSKRRYTLHNLLKLYTLSRGLSYRINGNKYIVFSQRASYGTKEKDTKQLPSTSRMPVIKVKGKVKDDKGDPIVGATVVQKGTQNGTVTDLDGNFELSAPEGSPIVVSYVGFNNLTVTARPKLNLTMNENAQTLNELVVIGYGSMKKKDLTGSLSVINSDEIASRRSMQLSAALQGAASGVEVMRSSGEPGAGASLRVRGVTTISDSSPLVIIDGVPGDINTVNPDDVQSISILKDAASAAIYGSRAAAGVVLITTKRAKAGQLNFTYNMEIGSDSPTRIAKYTGAVDYMKMVNELKYNDNPSGGWNQTYSQDLIDNYAQLNAQDPYTYPDTDWTKVLLKGHSSRQTHSLSLVSGGTTSQHKVSVRYDNEGGMYSNRNWERFMGRMNNDFKFGKFIEAHADADFRYSHSNAPNINPFDNEAINVPSIYGPTWSDGRYADVKDGANPLAKMDLAGWSKSFNTHVGFKGEVDFKPVAGLKLSVVAAPNFSFTRGKTFWKKYGYTYADDPNTIIGYPVASTSLQESRNEYKDITLQAIANYIHSWGRHEVALMAGYEYYYSRWENLSVSGDQFEFSEYPYLDISPKDYRDAGGNAGEYSYRSYFGRINYNYADRYLIEFNVRRDGSSRFASGHRWATFPSVSAGWVMSQEKWMKGIKWLDQLKFRASWGRLGNERIGSYYPTYASMNFGTTLIVDNDAVVGQTGTYQSQYAVKNITWETTESTDIGIDLAVLKSRLQFSFDWYHKETKDMLLALQIPEFLGFSNPAVNAGKMHTNGWDLELSWRDRINDFHYSAAFNFSDARSVMGDLRGTVFLGDQIKEQGSEFNQWYGYICEGTYQTDEEVANSARTNDRVKVGDLRYRDISGPNGVPDGKISAEYDRVLLKSSLPHLLCGLRLNAEWKGFDVGVTFQGVLRQWDRIYPMQAMGFRNGWTNFPQLIVGNYWSAKNSTEENEKARYPELTSNNENYWRMSTFWLYNKWYIRCKNITLGYTLPTALTKKFYVNSLRVYVAANDLFCIDNCLKGWDPETQANGYPIMKSIMFGMNLNF